MMSIRCTYYIESELKKIGIGLYKYTYSCYLKFGENISYYNNCKTIDSCENIT